MLLSRRGISQLGKFCSLSLLLIANVIQAEPLCPHIQVRGELDPGLSDTEKRLVCGDPKGREGWKEIPLSQAQFHFKTFLQDRGYYQPIFTRDAETLIVDLGNPTYVSQMSEVGAPESLQLDRMRKVVGEVLTPRILDTVEKWVVERLRADSYPCSKVTTQADPLSGEIAVKVETGPSMNLIAIEEESIPGVEPATLRRYDAFELNKPFNGDWTVLTENRIAGANLLQSAHFTVRCEAEGAIATQKVVPGPPRLLSVGFGANTEEYLLIKSRWRNSRLGLRASWFEVSALGSFRQQRLTTSANWYHLPYSSRRHLRPLAEVRHESEPDHRTLAARLQVAYATTWDDSSSSIVAWSGPTLDLFRTLRGKGEPNSKFLSLESSVEFKTHGYEFYKASPRTGFQSALTVGLADQRIVSTVSAQRLNWNFTGLWNYRDYDPPLWILGIRGGVETTVTNERPGVTSPLPAPLLHFLGGSRNLRGFGRRELPDDEGALTASLVAAELRLANKLPFQFEPFVFTDAGALSKEPVQIDSPLYWSPGLGLRWVSPIGVFRTTLARGYEASAFKGWQFYLSFGEEF